MIKPIRSVLLVVMFLTVFLNGCAPAPIPVTPTDTPISLPTSIPIPEAEILITDLEGNEIVDQDDSLMAVIINDSTGTEEYFYNWYRNGILLEGKLENTIDNDSMKTFTGEKKEYTLESKHTEHTIRGYVFRVEATNENKDVIASNSITISGPMTEIEMRGMNFVTWETRLTSFGQGKASLETMKSRLNTNWVSIWTLHYQDGLDATKIYSFAKGNPGTIPDEETIKQINAAHDLGMRVILYPQIWLYSPQTGGTPGNRERIVPSDTWFESYKEFILHQADIAESTNVEIFVIGVELSNSESKTKQWMELIDLIRQHYSGKITYSPIACGLNEIKLVYQIPWISELDYLGLSMNLAMLKENKDITLSEITRYFKEVEKEVINLSIFFDKPVIILESSTYAVDGALTHGPFGGRTDTPDHQEQADYYDAFLNVFGTNSYVKGIFWNQWLSTQENWYTKDSWWPIGIEIIGKPAERVLSSWYGGRVP